MPRHSVKSRSLHMHDVLLDCLETSPCRILRAKSLRGLLASRCRGLPLHGDSLIIDLNNIWRRLLKAPLLLLLTATPLHWGEAGAQPQAGRIRISQNCPRPRLLSICFHSSSSSHSCTHPSRGALRQCRKLGPARSGRRETRQHSTTI